MTASQVSIGWEGLPYWISAVSGALTLGVAVLAAIAARGAWMEASKQAAAAEAGLEIAERQAEQLGAQISAQQERERLLRRRDLEARIDAQAPTVLVRFERFDELSMRRIDAPNATFDRDVVLEEGDDRIFVVGALLSIENVSPHPARVAVPGLYEELSDSTGMLGSGRELVLAPGERRELKWQRSIHSLAFRDGEEVPERAYTLRCDFWVRDLGVNMRDTLQLVAGWTYFRRDGSRLIVSSSRPKDPSLPAAEPVGARVYERLDANEPGVDASTES